MAQIVGQKCVVCREQIGSAFDSHFCLSCGCPVHTACATAAQKSEGACSACGAPAAEVRLWREAAKRQPVLPTPGEQPSPGWVTGLRYAIGVLLFGGFALFIAPLETILVVTSKDGVGDPRGLAEFGITCAVLLGPPGYFVFPYKRRFQAVAWLSLACLSYGLFISAVLAVPNPISTPELQEKMNGLTVHYGRSAAVVAVHVTVWALLFRRKRG